MISYQSCIRIESDAGVCMVIRRGIVVGALTTLFGTFLSGALGLSVVAKTHPQPPWHDAQTFVSSFYPVQIVPYLVISMTSVAAIAMWGAKSVRATHDEKIGRMPGDELITTPIACLTHANHDRSLASGCVAHGSHKWGQIEEAGTDTIPLTTAAAAAPNASCLNFKQ